MAEYTAGIAAAGAGHTLFVIQEFHQQSNRRGREIVDPLLHASHYYCLSNGNLNLVGRRITQVDVVNVREDLIVTLAREPSADVITDIQRQTQSRDGLAKFDSRLRIFRQVTAFGFQ